MFDLLILNGKIVDGTGNPWYWGDLAIVDDKIVKIGRLRNEQAQKVIDVKGDFVSPGFIDSHSHSDLFIFIDPKAEQKIMQGVTTENLGLDGFSIAPINEENIGKWRKYLSGLDGDPNIRWKWRSFSDYLNTIDTLKPSVNLSSYIGMGTLRLKVIGMGDREATQSEISQMKLITAQAMEEGARGISAGLIYPPSIYQTMDEVVEIAKVARHYNGIYDVHMRNEGNELIQAMEEVIEIGRRSEIPVLITHFKVMGEKNWGLSEKALQLLDDVRREGLDVTIAQYPYTAASTMLHAIIPPWYHSRGPEKLIQAIKQDKKTIKKDLHERMDWDNISANFGWENIVVSSVEKERNKEYEGKTIAEIASMKNVDDPVDAALDLLADEELAVGMVIFCMSEEDVIRIMKHPTVNFITDGLLGGGKPHPRVYGTYPRILGRYVREQGILSIEDAIRKMTSLPAEKLRLKSRGMLIEGYAADITIFNQNTIIDNATFDNPKQFSSGIDWVIVNGQIVVEHGKHIGATPGKTIRAR
jgi:N-acyl-D-amino-acid deacylase